MDDEYPVIRCPFCGSVLTMPLPRAGMRECRYHLCRAVFPDRHACEPAQVLLVCEGGAGYTAREAGPHQEATGARKGGPSVNSARLPEEL